MIGVREFATEAEFQNPCKTFILPGVICSFCSSVRDMDLLRDPVLISNEKWLCTCGHPYNKSVIEASLVEIVQRHTMSYQLQDLICTKCQLVKPDNLSETCSSCSGSYVTKESESLFCSRFGFLQKNMSFDIHDEKLIFYFLKYEG
jgi:DNA polymerase epsilon subunit 1